VRFDIDCWTPSREVSAGTPDQAARSCRPCRAPRGGDGSHPTRASGVGRFGTHDRLSPRRLAPASRPVRRGRRAGGPRAPRGGAVIDTEPGRKTGKYRQESVHPRRVGRRPLYLRNLRPALGSRGNWDPARGTTVSTTPELRDTLPSDAAREGSRERERRGYTAPRKRPSRTTPEQGFPDAPGEIDLPTWPRPTPSRL
jgi:hypothetical protein